MDETFPVKHMLDASDLEVFWLCPRLAPEGPQASVCLAAVLSHLNHTAGPGKIPGSWVEKPETCDIYGSWLSWTVRTLIAVLRAGDRFASFNDGTNGATLVAE